MGKAYKRKGLEMPKREASYAVTSAPGEFPIIVEGSFTSTPQKGPQKDAKTEYKVTITYSNWDQVLAKAVRATIIKCGNLAVEGDFPYRNGTRVNVDHDGKPRRTLEDEMAELSTKSSEEQAAVLRDLEQKLAAMKQMYAAKESESTRDVGPEKRGKK